MELPVGTEVEVRGFPVGPRGAKWRVVDADSEGETFTVNKPGAKAEEAETVGMHDVRRVPRAKARSHTPSKIGAYL